MILQICFNDKDRDIALTKIQNNAIPACGATCAMLIVVLQRQSTPKHRLRIGKAIAAGTLTAAPQLAGQPLSAPFVGYWPAGATFTQAQWYTVCRNQSISINIPNVTAPFALNLNTIVDLYA